MLLWLTDYLSQFLPAFGVFQYLTFRTMVSAGTAMFLSL
ncbi:MAG: phospho-N-acetylmuramoyl-pentapeptide-transferase, partial [Pseudomonadota bacterium]|nr:phospho-N-acetylmuramoyl-pentapeptide-transferase [Pseudomonadota bacterium]